jgi:hypothetical protein
MIRRGLRPAEPPIGIEPMTYSLRVKRAASMSVHSWLLTCSETLAGSTVVQARTDPSLAPPLASRAPQRPVSRWQGDPERRAGHGPSTGSPAAAIAPTTDRARPPTAIVLGLAGERAIPTFRFSGVPPHSPSSRLAEVLSEPQGSARQFREVGVTSGERPRSVSSHPRDGRSALQDTARELEPDVQPYQ